MEGEVRVVITGGGTGGHLFPALAVCDELLRRRPETPVLFVGAAGGVEARILPRLGRAFHGIEVAQVQGRGRIRQLRALAALPGAVREAAGLLRRFAPAVVLGVGGYASFPTVAAAALLRIPRLLHEQNAVPGLANRWLGRMASTVAVSFEAAAPAFRGCRTAVTGNPVRAAIRPGDPAAARARLGLHPGRFTLLVFGGSQGAHRLNLALMEALPGLSGLGGRLQFVHATGEKELPEVRTAYAEQGMTAHAAAFFDDMATAYQAADFAITRAGAGTVFELAAMGLPALLVPYPYAANDHQRANAGAYVAAGAGWTALDRECDGQRVAAAIREAMEQPDRLRGMGEAARGFARPAAAARIADLLEALARKE